MDPCKYRNFVGHPELIFTVLKWYSNTVSNFVEQKVATYYSVKTSLIAFINLYSECHQCKKSTLRALFNHNISKRKCWYMHAGNNSRKFNQVDK